MADEQIPGTNSDVAVVVPDATAPATKKQRAPRVKKAAAEAKVKSSPSKTAEVSNGRKKRGGNGVEVAPAVTVEPVAVKRRSNGATKKQPGAVVSAPASASDEMAGLLQLEEENKRLRKTLADKLRAENADLRKKLGLA
jgi:putative transposase